ncbi:TPA: hypothetical protein OHO35_004992, partial [Escherichia coli]|nr:hypothetical protein [Escherichia coli]
MEYLITILSIIAVVIPAVLAWFSRKNLKNAQETLMHIERVRKSNSDDFERKKEQLK